MGERLLCKQEVAGSIPAGSIRKSLQGYRFRGLGRGAGRVVFLRCVPCVPHVREAGQCASALYPMVPTRGWGTPSATYTPSQRRTDVARLDRAFSAARPRSRRALAQPPACEARERPPPARCERKPQRNGTRAQCRLAWNSKATAAPLAFRRCRSEAGADRALPDAWSSSIPVVRRAARDTLASRRKEQRRRGCGVPTAECPVAWNSIAKVALLPFQTAGSGLARR